MENIPYFGVFSNEAIENFIYKCFTIDQTSLKEDVN
jgi:hypothetical protein